MVIQTRKNEIIVIDSISGVQMSKELIDSIQTIESHSTMPLLCVATFTGKIILFKIDEEGGNLNAYAEYFLSNSKIIELDFILNWLIAFDGENDLFLIEMNSHQQNKTNDIKKLIRCDHEFVDFSAMNIEKSLYVLKLCKSRNCERKASYCICTIIELDDEFEHKQIEISFDVEYSSIDFYLIDNEPCILATKSNEICVFQVKTSSEPGFKMSLLRNVLTPHSIGSIKLFCFDTDFISYGSDNGQILFWNLNCQSLNIAHKMNANGTKSVSYFASKR